MTTTITAAKIFLADERGLHQTAMFQSRQTFNFGRYQNEHKAPFGDIYLFNDDALDAGCSVRMTIEERSWVLLLPVVGAIHYKDSAGNENLVAAGQLQALLMEKNDHIEISNPFAEELVNFVQVWIRVGEERVAEVLTSYTFDVNATINQLVPACHTNEELPFVISIGKFTGRGETVYHARKDDAAVFLFVLEGAFEVEGRLLHARDGLALQNVSAIEMEALSNDAIILLVGV